MKVNRMTAFSSLGTLSFTGQDALRCFGADLLSRNLHFNVRAEDAPTDAAKETWSIADSRSPVLGEVSAPPAR